MGVVLEKEARDKATKWGYATDQTLDYWYVKHQ